MFLKVEMKGPETFGFTSKKVHRFACVIFFVFLVLFGVTRFLAVEGKDPWGNALAPDLAQFYVAGEMARQGEIGQLYDFSLVWKRINRVLEVGDETGTAFFYPPFVAWFCVPLSWMPYSVAAWFYFVGNMALGMGLGWAIAQKLLVSRYKGKEQAEVIQEARNACWLLVASVPFWRCILFGQNGLISLGLGWLFYTSLLKRKWGLAGGILALGFYKPQVFMGLWIWGLFWGNRRLYCGAVGVGLGLLVLGSWGGGLLLWKEWLLSLTIHEDALGSWARMHSIPSVLAPWIAATGGSLVAWVQVVLLVGVSGLGLTSLIVLRQQWKKKGEDQRKGEREWDVSLAIAILGWALVSPRWYQYDLVFLYPLLVGWWVCLRREDEAYGSRDTFSKQVAWWVQGRFWFLVVILAFYFVDGTAAFSFSLLTWLGLALFLRLCWIPLRSWQGNFL